MKLAIVVQRYGPAINGGAELHARYIAERLARHAQVEVLTTCAADYVSWRNELPPGADRVNGVPIRRFHVAHERDPLVFARRSERVFDQLHSVADELAWLDAEGPASPSLTRYIATHAADYDFLIFFSYRYYHAYHGVRAATSRAILVPTAERDSAIGVSIFKPIFKSVRAVMYNSPEERALIHAVAGNQDVPGVVVGVGSNVPANPQPARFRGKFNIRGPFAIYVGRIDENKGCSELFEFFQAYADSGNGRLSLVLVGNSLLPVPSHPRIRHLGFLNDTDKFDAMMAADLLIMPSYFESLSMVALEAWALGRPVLANARCDVLKGQCIRSNAGLYYDGSLEFVETLRAIEQNPWLGGSLGRNGRIFFRENYDWSVIERKYLDMLNRLAKEPATRTMEALPGWFRRRAATCPPGAQVLAATPSGPHLVAEPTAPGAGLASPSSPSARRSLPDRRRHDSPRPPTFDRRRGSRRDRSGAGSRTGRT